MRFLVDTQLPTVLTQFLRDQGQQAEHALELGFGQSKDSVLWDYAGRNHAVIVSKDEDFADWIARGKEGPAVLWLRVGNCTNASLLTRVAALWPQILARLDHGERLVELR